MEIKGALNRFFLTRLCPHQPTPFFTSQWVLYIQMLVSRDYLILEYLYTFEKRKSMFSFFSKDNSLTMNEIPLLSPPFSPPPFVSLHLSFPVPGHLPENRVGYLSLLLVRWRHRAPSHSSSSLAATAATATVAATTPLPGRQVARKFPGFFSALS